MMEDNKKYLNQTMDEIVFDNRNKSYGAFFLRQLTQKNTIRALVLMGIVSVLLTSFTYIDFGFLTKKGEDCDLNRWA